MIQQLLKQVHIFKHNEFSVIISNKELYFSYTNADTVVKDELKGKYRYWGGLQCGFDADSAEYKELETALCELAERTLGIQYPYDILEVHKKAMWSALGDLGEDGFKELAETVVDAYGIKQILP